MRYRKTENTMSLLGGALLGAAAMYLLDPEMGRRRRAAIKDQAGDYLDSAQDTLQGGWETATTKARGLGKTIADKAKDYGDRLSDLAQDYSDRLSEHAKDVASSVMGQAKDVGSDWRDRAADATEGARSSMADTISDWRSRGRKWLSGYAKSARKSARDRADEASDYASDLADDSAGRARGYADDITDYGQQLWDEVRGLGKRLRSRSSDAIDRARGVTREREVPAVPIAVTAVGCAALGLGFMYLMDPKRGRERRAWLADTMTGWARNAGQTFYRTGKDVAARTYGGQSARTGSGPEPVGPMYSEQLLDRVQSAINRVAPQPNQIQVMADINGSVTLTGTIRPQDTDRVIAAVEDVQGVNLVINRLEVRSGEGSPGKGVPQM